MVEGAVSTTEGNQDAMRTTDVVRSLSYDLTQRLNNTLQRLELTNQRNYRSEKQTDYFLTSNKDIILTNNLLDVGSLHL